MMNNDVILKVEDLKTYFNTDDGIVGDVGGRLQFLTVSGTTAINGGSVTTRLPPMKFRFAR